MFSTFLCLQMAGWFFVLIARGLLFFFFWSKLFFSRASTDRKQEALFQEVKILFLNGRSNIRNAHLKIDIHSWCIVAGLRHVKKSYYFFEWWK